MSFYPEARTPALTIEYQTEAERLLLEQALAFFAQMRQRSGPPPMHGSGHLRARGAGPGAPTPPTAPQKSRNRLKGRRPRWLLTALGRICLWRQYAVTADGGQFPADAALGVDGYVTAGRNGWPCWSARDPFARAGMMLRESEGGGWTTR